MSDRETRDGLVLELELAEDRLDAGVERMMSRSVGASLAELREARDAAAQSLRDFDAAHPEVIAEIEAERKERAERHLWD